MVITPGHVVLPLVIIAVGGGLIFAGLGLGWGAVWAMAGGFFITVGLVAGLLNLAWLLPPGNILRHPLVNLLMLLAVLFMLCATVYMGVMRR